MNEPQTYFKVLVNGESSHGGRHAWSLPADNGDGTWTPGEWTPRIESLVNCECGWHATTWDGVWSGWAKAGMAVYELEYREPPRIIEDGSHVKVIGHECRLLRPVDAPAWWREAMRFVTEDIPVVPWFRPDGEPDPAWRLFEADTLAAARDAAWDSARDAAWDSAGDAARAAAWAAARDAALDAAGDAAWDAAWDAAGATAWAAALDAALVARLAIVSDLGIEERHSAHIQDRWSVWQKGYRLLCDVDGVLFVYAAKAVL